MTQPVDPTVGLVLAGGGARGAYEVGVLAELLPYLEERGERPGVIVGTSIGALNGAYLAATAHLPAEKSIDEGLKLWREVTYRDICDPLVSTGELWRLLVYLGELLGVPNAEVESLLDNSPMEDTVPERIEFDQLHANVENGALARLAVVATSYATGESVVFHHGRNGAAPPFDAKRNISYVATPIAPEHVRASAAIPVFFPAVQLDGGWFGDGGTRLNTPIKPALKLGAERVVVIGLNSSVPHKDPAVDRPDIFDGATQFVQALLADQLTQDLQTLATENVLLHGAAVGDRRPVPYILVAPKERLEVGRLARDVYNEQLAGPLERALPRTRDLAMLGHILGAGRNAVRGDLLSFLLFHRPFVDRLITRGRRDAERFIDDVGGGDPWRLDPP